MSSNIALCIHVRIKLVRWSQYYDTLESYLILRDDNSKLVEFANKLKNAVAAIKSVGKNEGYLRNPELVDRILSKLPSSIINNYVRDRPIYPENNSDLKKLSDFMFYEAKLNIAAGIIPSQPSNSKLNRSRSDKSSDRVVLVAQTTENDVIK